MHATMPVQPADAQATAGLTRRSLGRGALAAAWAVPAIQVATATPSFANSGRSVIAVDTVASSAASSSGNVLNVNLVLALTGLPLPVGTKVSVSLKDAAFVDGNNGKAYAPTVAFTPNNFSSTQTAFGPSDGVWRSWMGTSTAALTTANTGTAHTLRVTVTYSGAGQSHLRSVTQVKVDIALPDGRTQSFVLTQS